MFRYGTRIQDEDLDSMNDECIVIDSMPSGRLIRLHPKLCLQLDRNKVPTVISLFI